MNLPERDGDGYLTDMGAWTQEIGQAMAQADAYELDDVKWAQILKARECFEEFSSVPPIRKFTKYLSEEKKRGLQALDDRPDDAHHQIH
jgi:tRNA 2-thiouridine synthesizing protein E